jgi:hypothetical protein
MRTADPLRFWGMALGVALASVALAVAAVRAQPARPQTPAARPQTVPTAKATAAKPLTDAERQTVQELQAEQKRLDSDSARVMAATPDGRRRVTETIARQFRVADKVVDELRARKMGYGEASITLALSQQLMKTGLTQPQAIDKVVGMRKSGMGWGVVARDLGLKLGRVISDVKRADTQLVKLDAVNAAKTEKVEKVAKAEKPGKPEKIERPTKPEKADKAR